MESTKWKKIYGISLGVATVGIFAAAVALAVSAGKEPVKRKTRLQMPSRRGHKAGAHRVHRRPTTHKPGIVRPPINTKQFKPTGKFPKLKRPSELMVHPAMPKLRTGAPSVRPKVGLTGAAAPIRHPGAATGPGYGPPGYGRGTPGLSAEERKKSRIERQNRQARNLRRRIQSLQERINTAKNDGSRSDQQIHRMTQSLERMQSRLSKIEKALQADNK